jgi:hypothetical protein
MTKGQRKIYDRDKRLANLDRYTQNSKKQIKKLLERNPNYYKVYNKTHPDIIKKAVIAWRERNPEYVKEYNSISFNKLKRAIRNSLQRLLKCTDTFKMFKSIDYVGCSIYQLKDYIESKFKQGMSWENYGLNGWHIDHIKPLSSFTVDNIMEANHYTNLQPLWAKENLIKSNFFT